MSADTKADVIYGRRLPKQSSRPIFDWFLIGLACLVPIDVSLRRIQIDMYAIKSLFGLVRRAGPSTATMGTLLQRKQAIGDELAARRETASPAPRPTSTIPKPRTRPTTAKTQPPPPAQKPSPKPGETEEGMSTTERLLNLKRKRDEDQKS